MTPTPETAGAILDIDLGAIVANWRSLAERNAEGLAGAVVKADAYGLGAKAVAPALYAAGCRHFFVALVHEAAAIRPLLPDAMIAALGGLIPGTAPLYRQHAITPVLGSLAEVAEWASNGGGQPAILHVDTGMHRLGLSPSEWARLRQEPTLLSGITITYVMTHLVSSEIPSDVINMLQAERFSLALDGFLALERSFANSSGIFLDESFASDLVRPGAALYGINPTPGRPNPMRRVVGLSARVLAVRDVVVGESVGYNATWRAVRHSRIATAGIGYADGLHRALSNRGQAFFDGRPLPLVGRVSMDLTTFDVTDHPGVVPGVWLEILGPNQSPDDLAALAGTNGYEILTSLGHRFARVYRHA